MAVKGKDGWYHLTKEQVESIGKDNWKRLFEHYSYELMRNVLSDENWTSTLCKRADLGFLIHLAVDNFKIHNTFNNENTIIVKMVGVDKFSGGLRQHVIEGNNIFDVLYEVIKYGVDNFYTFEERKRADEGEN